MVSAYYDPTQVNAYLNNNPSAPAVDDGAYGPNMTGTATLPPPVAPYSPPAQVASSRPGYIPGTDPEYDARLRQQQAMQASINSRGQYATAEQNWAQAQQAVTPYRQGVVNAQAAVFPYQQGVVNAQGGVLQARSAAVPAQRQQLAAQQGVITAQGAQTAGQRGLIQQQQNENTLQAGEYAREQAALNNTADQAAVARASRQRAATDIQNRSYGITPAADVLLPVGATAADVAKLPPGTRQAYQTQAQDVARANAAAQTTRGFNLDAAKLVVSLMGNDTQAAQNAAAQAGMTVAQAQELVNEAQLQAGYASNAEQGAQIGVSRAQNAEAGAQVGVQSAAAARDVARANDFATSSDVSQAGLDLSEAQTPPFPGAVHPYDPNTGTRLPDWVTPAEADASQTQYELNLSQQRQGVQTGGSQLAAIPTGALVNQWSTNSISPPGGGSVNNTQITNELVRRLQQQGYNEEQAKAAAKQLIADEVDRRQRAARATQGRPSAVS